MKKIFISSVFIITSTIYANNTLLNKAINESDSISVEKLIKSNSFNEKELTIYLNDATMILESRRDAISGANKIYEFAKLALIFKGSMILGYAPFSLVDAKKAGKLNLSAIQAAYLNIIGAITMTAAFIFDADCIINFIKDNKKNKELFNEAFKIKQMIFNALTNLDI